VFRVGGLPTSYQLLLPSGHPDNPFTGYRAAAVFRFAGTDASSENVNKTYRFLTGLKGTAGAFDWESGLLYNRTERDDLGHGYLYFPVVNRIVTENRLLASHPARRQGLDQLRQAGRRRDRPGLRRRNPPGKDRHELGPGTGSR
jgi:iron complex outermembrane receptor protein